MSGDVTIRRFFTEAEDKWVVCAGIYFLTWMGLWRFYDSFDLPILAGLCNINLWAGVYTHSNTVAWHDPDRAYTFLLQLLILMDTFSCWLVAVHTFELKQSSMVKMCLFGKMCLVAHLLLRFDDRWVEIMAQAGVSLALMVWQTRVYTQVTHRVKIECSTVKDWFRVYVMCNFDLGFQVSCFT